MQYKLEVDCRPVGECFHQGTHASTHTPTDGHVVNVIQVKLSLLRGNILSTCQYFKPTLFSFFHCTAFLICVYSLNVPAVSYLRIIMYDSVCMLYVLMYL